MAIQRYVSPDLTHFVGRRQKSLDKQYRILKQILKEGTLRAPAYKKEPYLTEADKRKPHWLAVHPSARLSSNNAYSGSFVCFCDIPIGDLDLHIRKYGRFGLAFSKTFVLGKGVKPVCYIPLGGRPALLPWASHRRPTRSVSSNAALFDRFWTEYKKLRQAAETESSRQRHTEEWLRHVMQFLDLHLLSHLKFFDSSGDDWDKENFYMEREWRVSENIKFRLQDVRRVIISESYAQRFRSDFPKYSGEVAFARLTERDPVRARRAR